MATDREIIDSLCVVGGAFFGNFQRPRDVQRRAIPRIRDGGDVLVVSATASGKTEAILAPLVFRALQGTRPANGSHIRILIIAPTRALVNDLSRRLESPLTRLGLTCGRQTSDRRDKGKRPFLLITTPESFDSMLVRDGSRQDGKLVDHLLSRVAAVYIDEAHMFDGTARGDQLCWLLSRLRRLRRLDKDGLRAGLQTCAGSATVSNPADLANRLCGPNAAVVHVAGTGKIEVFDTSDEVRWSPLDQDLSITTLRDKLEITPTRNFAKSVERRLLDAISDMTRKVLIFVPSRRMCDTLSTHLAGTLPRKYDLLVLAHHGSLTRTKRGDAEHTFSTTHNAVLVATTTMEVGVDIGDVDLVVLVGAPPGTRSLLQRIGRAGRRICRTKVLPFVRTEIERSAIASMLISARDGKLESEGYAHRWSVLVQQAASFVAQAGPRGRTRTDLFDLAQDVWPDPRPQMAKSIVEHLIGEGYLVDERGRLRLGEPWADLFGEGKRGMHANLDESFGGTPVVDASTGEVIAHVDGAANGTLALGGQRWHAQTIKGEVILNPAGAGPVSDEAKYASRRGPTGHEYAVHARRGAGLGETDAPILDSSDGPVWLHFGGSAYQALLCALLPRVRPIAGLAGLAVNGHVSDTDLAEVYMRGETLRDEVEERFEILEPALSPGPYQRRLSEQCRRQVVVDLFDLSAFCGWLSSRKVWKLTRHDERWTHLRTLLPPT